MQQVPFLLPKAIPLDDVVKTLTSIDLPIQQIVPLVLVLQFIGSSMKKITYVHTPFFLSLSSSFHYDLLQLIYVTSISVLRRCYDASVIYWFIRVARWRSDRYIPFCRIRNKSKFYSRFFPRANCNLVLPSNCNYKLRILHKAYINEFSSLVAVDATRWRMVSLQHFILFYFHANECVREKLTNLDALSLNSPSIRPVSQSGSSGPQSRLSRVAEALGLGHLRRRRDMHGFQLRKRS
jgi:hypothetical protein